MQNSLLQLWGVLAVFIGLAKFIAYIFAGLLNKTRKYDSPEKRDADYKDLVIAHLIGDVVLHGFLVFLVFSTPQITTGETLYLLWLMANIAGGVIVYYTLPKWVNRLMARIIFDVILAVGFYSYTLGVLASR